MAVGWKHGKEVVVGPKNGNRVAVVNGGAGPQETVGLKQGNGVAVG